LLSRVVFDSARPVLKAKTSPGFALCPGSAMIDGAHWELLLLPLATNASNTSVVATLVAVDERSSKTDATFRVKLVVLRHCQAWRQLRTRSWWSGNLQRVRLRIQAGGRLTSSRGFCDPIEDSEQATRFPSCRTKRSAIHYPLPRSFQARFGGIVAKRLPITASLSVDIVRAEDPYVRRMQEPAPLS
jgi:hypothetical protein